MKRFVAGLLLIAICIGILVGCKKNKYEPVPSTEEEARTVMKINIGERCYEVRYELYRAFFLTYRREIDGGDASVWQGDGKEEYINRINEKIISEVTRIYAVFELCERLGIDLYSKEVEDEIYEMIEVSIDGGTWGGENVAGFGGDSEKYRESLRAAYHNDSTAMLLIRYGIGQRRIEEHYIGAESYVNDNGQITEGALKYTTEKVRNFYNSPDTSQILFTYITGEMDTEPKERAERVRTSVIEAANSGAEAVRILMINSGHPTAFGEIENGMVVGEHTLSRDYSAIYTAASGLSDCEVSEVIETVSASDGERYYVIYKAEKSEEYFEVNYAAVVESYLLDAVGSITDLIAKEMAQKISYTDAYGSIIHAEVKI